MTRRMPGRTCAPPSASGSGPRPATSRSSRNGSQRLHRPWCRCRRGASVSPAVTTLGQLVFSGILIGGIYALMSIGLTLIFGVLRIVNFAHGEFLMLGMYGAWTLSTMAELNPYMAALAIVPAMFLFGGLVHRIIISPALDKPHLVVVFATMGLSIFMQNVALMMMTADLWDVPPVFSRAITIGPFFFKPELLLGFAITIACTSALPSSSSRSEEHTSEL